MYKEKEKVSLRTMFGDTLDVENGKEKKEKEGFWKGFGIVVLAVFLAAVTSLADGLYCHYFLGVNLEFFGVNYFGNSKLVIENNEANSNDTSNSENNVVTTNSNTEDSSSQVNFKLDEKKSSGFKMIAKIVLAIILFFPLVILNVITLGVVASIVGEFGAGLLFIS